MADHTVAAGERGTAAFALTAATVDTVTFTDKISEVEVITDGAADVWYTTNGSTPTVGGKNCWYLPTNAVADVRAVTSSQGSAAVVKLISAGTPTLRVQHD